MKHIRLLGERYLCSKGQRRKFNNPKKSKFVAKGGGGSKTRVLKEWHLELNPLLSLQTGLSKQGTHQAWNIDTFHPKLYWLTASSTGHMCNKGTFVRFIKTKCVQWIQLHMSYTCCHHIYLGIMTSCKSSQMLLVTRWVRGFRSIWLWLGICSVMLMKLSCNCRVQINSLGFKCRFSQ